MCWTLGRWLLFTICVIFFVLFCFFFCFFVKEKTCMRLCLLFPWKILISDDLSYISNQWKKWICFLFEIVFSLNLYGLFSLFIRSWDKQHVVIFMNSRRSSDTAIFLLLSLFLLMFQKNKNVLQGMETRRRISFTCVIITK